MKKLIASISTATTGLALSVPQVFAANGNLNPCDKASGITEQLCKAQDNSLGSIIGFAVTILFIVAVLIALVFLILGGIKWITSGGDKANVETARNQIIAAVVGLILVFLSFFILNLVLQAFNLSLFSLQLPKFPGT